MVVAIDGPAGSGKSTVAKILAEKMGFIYLDTGAMYRALTWWLLKNRFDLSDEEKITREAQKINIELKKDKVFVEGEDVSKEIREPIIDKNISSIAKLAQVRKVMVEKQREIAKNSNCIAEGRDTTTVVFPQAELKIFLDADFQERVKRRHLDFEKKNIKVDKKSLEEDLRKRDNADINRKVSPLRVAEEAIYIDTTDLKIEEVVEKIYSLILEKKESK